MPGEYGQPNQREFCVSSGAGDGNRTNPNEPNKGVTTRSTVQLESNGVKSKLCAKRASFSVRLKRQDTGHL
jgi:hypothetical protein